MQTAHTSILALDVGDVRIGLAIADSFSRLAKPLKTISHSKDVFNNLQTLISDHNVEVLVVGLPRGLDGQITQQTKKVKEFIKRLRQTCTLPIHEQDEAVTSVQAEAELATRRQAYDKSDIDALAATYILEDYLHSGAEHRDE